jgi:hypothetical protein
MTERLPNLVIAGVGKAGTTSLFWYLSQHPDVCPSRVKEIGYFKALVEGGVTLPPIDEYRGHFDRCAGERYRLEASPQYFHGGTRVIEAMREVLGTPKVILMFRDPVDRMWSQYRFMRTRLSDLPADVPFEMYADRCLEMRRTRQPLGPESRRYWAVQGGFYVEHLDPWVDAFGDDLRLVFFERLATAPELVFGELCAWLEVEEHAGSISFSVENRTVPVRSRALQRIALAANDERFLRRHRRLKGPLRRLYYAVNRRPTREAMPTETERRLREEFAPGNRTLAAKVTALGYRDLPGWLSGAGIDAAGRASA